MRIANTLFGGTAEYVALWLKDAGMSAWFYWYVAAMIGLSLIVYATMRDTKRTAGSTRICALSYFEEALEVGAKVGQALRPSRFPTARPGPTQRSR